MSGSGEGESPVSYPVNVMRLPAKGLAVRLEADEAQRAALAAAHGLLAVERFGFELTVKPWQRQGVHVTGKVSASIVQSCVVTLAPVAARIEEDVSALYVPEGSRLDRLPEIQGGEMILEAESADPPETFQGNSIDVGAAAEEFFSLAVDSYPRAPGAALPAETASRQEEEPKGPLAQGLGAFARRKQGPGNRE